MDKIRVYQLAKKLNIDSKDLVKKIKAMGIMVSSYQSAISASQAESIEKKLSSPEKASAKKVIIRRKKKPSDINLNTNDLDKKKDLSPTINDKNFSIKDKIVSSIGESELETKKHQDKDKNNSTVKFKKIIKTDLKKHSDDESIDQDSAQAFSKDQQDADFSKKNFEKSQKETDTPDNLAQLSANIQKDPKKPLDSEKLAKNKKSINLTNHTNKAFINDFAKKIEDAKKEKSIKKTNVFTNKLNNIDNQLKDLIASEDNDNKDIKDKHQDSISKDRRFSKATQDLINKSRLSSKQKTTKSRDSLGSARIIKKSSEFDTNINTKSSHSQKIKSQGKYSDSSIKSSTANKKDQTLSDTTSQSIASKSKSRKLQTSPEDIKPRSFKKERKSELSSRNILSRINSDSEEDNLPRGGLFRKKTVYSPMSRNKFRDHRKRTNTKKTQITTPKASLRVVLMKEDTISVGELARQLSLKSADLIKYLMNEGMMVSVNERLDMDVASLVANNYNYEIKIDFQTIEQVLDRSKVNKKDLIERAPIVTLMGHVDHGKTSILDAIRQTSVIKDESGGITQHIGAYQVNYLDKKITFLDTPGHAAFSNIRIRGAKVTDVVVLVVAADDGVMPQTIEAISHAKNAEVPIIVAINKVDKPNVNFDRINNELAEHGIQSESWGGEHQFVNISALKKTGINDLLESILLQAELMELKVSEKIQARGVIIEAHMDTARGAIATIMVTEGVFKVKDTIVAGLCYARIRVMINDQGKKVNSAGPSTPVEVFGFTEVPSVGDVVDFVKDHETAKNVAQIKKAQIISKAKSKSAINTLEDLIAKVDADKIISVPMIIKSDTQGSLQAITEALSDIKSVKVKAKIVHQAVGPINSSDITLAEMSSSVIFAFNVRSIANIEKDAKSKGVVIEYFGVIYELIDAASNILAGSLPPIKNEIVIGHADVRKTIRVPKVGVVAGCAISDGRVTRHSMLRLIREDVVIYTGKIGSLRRFKDDVKEVAIGYECGISIENCKDIREGDVIEAYEIEEVSATL